MARSSLSAALLLIAYILQQRLRPFLVSSTLSEGLSLTAGEMALRLQLAQGGEGGPLAKGTMGSVPSSPDARIGGRNKSRVPSMDVQVRSSGVRRVRAPTPASKVTNGVAWLTLVVAEPWLNDCGGCACVTPVMTLSAG